MEMSKVPIWVVIINIIGVVGLTTVCLSLRYKNSWAEFVGMITVAATAGFGIGRDYMIRKNLLSMITMTGLLIGALEFFDSRFRMLGFDFFQSSFPFLMAINVLLVSFTAGSIIAKCSGRVLAKKMPEQNPET